MGVIDQATHTARCECGNTESVRIVQHGSAYGASWQGGKPMNEFDVSWGKEGPIGPEIERAVCRKCSRLATVEIT